MKEALCTASDRKVLRRQVQMPCQVVREADFKLVGDACLDLSPHGMRVRSLCPVTIGTRLLVSFRLSRSGLHMDLSAVVSRISRGRRRGERFATLGLSFVDVSPVEQVTLMARLRGLSPPTPARHLRMDYARAVRTIHGALAHAAPA